MRLPFREMNFTPQLMHRKQVQHFNVPEHAHRLTFSCYRRERLLTNNLFRGILARSLDKALETQR